MARPPETLLLDEDGAVLTVTLNRPDRRNALSPELHDELAEVWEHVRSSDTLRVVILTGAGTAFCAGGDFGSQTEDRLGKVSPLLAEANRRRNGRQVEEILALPVPVVAAVNGAAIGAGCNLALACDIVLAADNARFGQLHAKRGFAIDMGGSWLLPRLVGLHKAKELALVPDLVLGAEEAATFGLINRVVPAGSLMEEARGLAARIATGAPVGIRLTKEGLNRSHDMTLGEALTFEALAQALCVTTEDVIEGVRAFIEKRDPEFRGR